MNIKQLAGPLSFLAGVAIGSFVTYKMVYKKAQERADEEIESVREAFGRRTYNFEAYRKIVISRYGEDVDRDILKQSTDAASKIVEDAGDDQDVNTTKSSAKMTRIDIPYTDYTKFYDPSTDEDGSLADDLPEEEENNEEDQVVPLMDPNQRIPYIVLPDQFGEIEDYDRSTLHYWTDGILTNDYDEVIDIAEFIGEDSVNHFGEYEQNVVYVRNDRYATYYEILKEEDPFFPSSH